MYDLYRVFCIILALLGNGGYSYLIRRARWSEGMGRVVVHAVNENSQSSPTSGTIDQWWQSTDHLLTIGSAGLTTKHINSLKNLVQEHGWVKVKLASNKINAKEIADGVVQSDALAGLVKLLAVRGRFFAVGNERKVS
jgi:RNA-binding protein YhbY